MNGVWGLAQLIAVAGVLCSAGAVLATALLYRRVRPWLLRQNPERRSLAILLIAMAPVLVPVAAIVDAMVQSIVASAPPAQPGETELLHFYRENIAYFSSPPLLQVQRMEFRGEGAARRARDARAALIDGESFDEVEAALADKPVVAVPGAPIPANRLVQYLGPTPVGQLTELEVGAISGPHAREGGLQLVRLAGRVEGVAPPLQQVRAQVLREYRRRASEAHLREYLDDLRAAADIRHQAVPEAASGPAAR